MIPIALLERTRPRGAAAPCDAAALAYARFQTTRDPVDFNTAFAPWHRQLLRFFLSRTKDRGLSDDLTQETAHRLLATGASYRPECSFKSFLFTIANNLLIDHRRAQQVRPINASALQLSELRAPQRPLGRERGDSDSLSPLGQCMDRDERAKLRAVVDDLPEIYQKVADCMIYKDLGYDGTAQALGIPSGTVKSRLHEATRRIHEAFAADQEQ